MNTKIMHNNPKKNYNMGLDIEITFKKGEYFKALMMTCNTIESFLRRFYTSSYRIQNKGKLLTDDVDTINRLSLGLVTDWANCKILSKKGAYILPPPKKKILNNKQYKIFSKLRQVRNDIAHTYYLNYDENINPEYAEKVIRNTIPVINGIIKKYNLFVNSSSYLTKQKINTKTP